MNVGVTILASLSDVAEYHLDVTLDAGHRLVHAAQRIARLIVIEFRNRANRSPPGCGVAVLTRQVEISVWTVRNCRILSVRTSTRSGKCQEQHGDQIEPAPRP